MEQTLPKLKTNLDTNLLKLVAVVCMLLDHFGGTFFEQVPAFRWAGRLAFPLFCYCMTVGCCTPTTSSGTWGDWDCLR